MHHRLALAAALFAPAAGAAERLADAAASPVGVGQLAQVIGGLALVVVLIFGLAVAARRLRLGRGVSGRHLKVIDALALGARERLLLVEVAGERVLLGLTAGRIERLHVLDAEPMPVGDFPAALGAALERPAEAA
jgi:flagellar protein FliO/FliZ